MNDLLLSEQLQDTFHAPILRDGSQRVGWPPPL
jgi:hypothetical protein